MTGSQFASARTLRSRLAMGWILSIQSLAPPKPRGSAGMNRPGFCLKWGGLSNPGGMRMPPRSRRGPLRCSFPHSLETPPLRRPNPGFPPKPPKSMVLCTKIPFRREFRTAETRISDR